MANLEQEMRKALEGKFYWEPTSDPSDAPSPAEQIIRRAQRKFGPRKVIKARGPDDRTIENKIAFAKKALHVYREVFDKKADPFTLLKVVIANVYGIAVTDLLRQTNNNKICEAKHHFYWALPRFFPGLSIAELGRQVNRHHSVVLHSKKKFEAKKTSYMEEIEIVDKAMEGVCGL